MGQICKRGFAASITTGGDVNPFANLVRCKGVYSCRRKKSVIKVRIGKRICNTSTNDLFYFCEFCTMKNHPVENRTKKVLILSSSPRRGGNFDTLCDEFMRGAAEAGNEVKISE